MHIKFGECARHGDKTGYKKGCKKVWRVQQFTKKLLRVVKNSFLIFNSGIQNNLKFGPRSRNQDRCFEACLLLQSPERHSLLNNLFCCHLPVRAAPFNGRGRYPNCTSSPRPTIWSTRSCFDSVHPMSFWEIHCGVCHTSIEKPQYIESLIIGWF